MSEHVGKLAWFGPRVGAGTYLLTMSAAVNVWCLVVLGLYYYGIAPNRISLPTVSYAIWVLGAVVALLFFYLSKRRFQDLNCPPIWANLMAFPLFGIVLLPALCFVTPLRIANRFGRPPLPSGKLKVAVALASFILALVLVQVVARLYAPLHVQSPY